MGIQKAAVIGAGNMGSGIAAQLANAGVDVELMDIVPTGAADRNVIAASAIEKMLGAKKPPQPLMHPRNVKRIRAGNIEDNLDRLKDCDLIIEAVLEDPAIKSALYKKIDAHRKSGSIVASNTSTLRLRDLVEGQSEQFRKDFVVTHFFNPPRYMPLLELVTSEHNDPAKTAMLAEFMDVRVGKVVVSCNDTPGFIANRIGLFWIQCAVNGAFDLKLTVEEADAVVGRPMGIPKTGVFGLGDLVGIDLVPYLAKGLLSTLPADDGYAKIYKASPLIDKMIAAGYTGRKGKGGFYRLGENREKLAVDLETGAVRPAFKPKLKAVKRAKKGGIPALISTDDKYGRYAWDILGQTLSYVAQHAHDIATDIQAVDAAMRLGYNWKYGPFEMLDQIGVDAFVARLESEGAPVPPLLQQMKGKTFYRVHNGMQQFINRYGAYENVHRAPGVLLLADIKRASKPVDRNMSASLWDIGDGILCAEFHSKMNALDFMSMRMLNRACDIIGDGKGKFRALVIHNEGEHFSVGANIGYALVAAKLRQYWLIEKMVKQGQDTLKRLKYAPFPVVSAPAGQALGGGCEVLLHSDHVQAHAETYPGLVEVGVGLLPAWGGSTELLCRAFRDKKTPGGPMPAVARIFETISTAKVGFSAEEARDLFYLRRTDGITMKKSRLLADAKAKALELAKDYKPEEPQSLRLPGPTGLAALRLAVDGFYLKGAATPYDVVVSDKVAEVLTGGPKADTTVTVTQDYVRMLERKYFMQLVRDSRTIKRIESILKSGKPLREKPAPEKTAQDLRDSAESSCPACTSVNDNIVRDTRPRVNWPG